ncbi:MAG: hypothetical protein RIR00_1637 [Pseudomonadota bacterium]|jgi:adenylylsulfate kinase
MVIWLIGLSGAGKTTIGERVAARLRAGQPNVVFLDGDMLREVWGANLGHHVEGRRANAERISRLCRLLERQGIVVVAAVLSIFPEWQEWNRREFSSYFEVFIDAPLELVELRDAKGIYTQARRGEASNVVGIDIPFPRPAAPDLVIGGVDLARSPDELAADIVAQLARGAARAES